MSEESPLGPKVHLSPLPPTRQGVSGRTLAGSLLLLGAAALAVVVLVLLHGSATVPYQGTPVDYDGTSAGESFEFDVRCVPAVGGTEGFVVPDDDGSPGGDGEDTSVRESAGVSGDSPDFGLEAGEVSSLCDRARAARVAHSVETGFFVLLLLAGGTVVLHRRRPAEA